MIEITHVQLPYNFEFDIKIVLCIVSWYFYLIHDIDFKWWYQDKELDKYLHEFIKNVKSDFFWKIRSFAHVMEHKTPLFIELGLRIRQIKFH